MEEAVAEGSGINPRRKIKPPSSILEYQFSEARNDLERYLEIDKSQLENPNHAIEVRNSLKVKWAKYEDIFCDLQESYKDEGAEDEAKKRRDEFLLSLKKVKVLQRMCKEILFATGTKSISSISEYSFASRSSDVRREELFENLKIARAKRASRAKLFSVEKEMLTLNLRSAQRNIELDEKMATIKADEEVAILEAKLSALSLSEPVEENSAGVNSLPVKRMEDPSKAKRASPFSDISEIAPASRVPVPQQSTFKTTPRLPVSVSAQMSNKNSNIFKPPDYATAGSVKPKRRAYFHEETKLDSSTDEEEFKHYTGKFSSTNVNKGGLNRRLNVDAPVFQPIKPERFTEIRDSSRDFSRNIGMDPATRHLATMELKRAPHSPFRGKASEFHNWLKALDRRMDELNLSPMDRIKVLEAHSDGPPKEVIKTFSIAFSHNPELALKTIITKLEKRFGGNVQVAVQIRSQLLKFPEIKGSE